jgi:hypothetical protein
MIALLIVILVLWKLSFDVQMLKKERMQTKTPLFPKKRVGFANKEKEPANKKDEKNAK